MRFGDLLIKVRTDRKISLRDLAKAVELSPIYLSDIERGNRKPPAPTTIVRIASALGSDPLAFLRAALKERDSIELSLRPTEDAGVMHETALSLARFWDHADDDALEMLRQYLEEHQSQRRERP